MVWARSWGPRKHSSKRGFRSQIIFLPSVLNFPLGQLVDYVTQVSTLAWILRRERSIKALAATKRELLLSENTQRLVTAPAEWGTIFSGEPESRRAGEPCLPYRHPHWCGLAGSRGPRLCIQWAVLFSRQRANRSLHRIQGGRGGACVEYIGFLTECLSSKIVFHRMHPHIKASKVIELLKTGF